MQQERPAEVNAALLEFLKDSPEFAEPVEKSAWSEPRHVTPAPRDGTPKFDRCAKVHHPKGEITCMSDLRDWLRGNNLEQYAEAFEANDIDLDILADLNDAISNN